MNKNITVIWWWNWNSSILKWFYNHKDFNNLEINSIVSMSDDGRTTWLLMRQMKKWLNIHMPPPWDLRRCLFALSSSDFRSDFEKLFETVIDFEWKIKNFNIWEILEKLEIKNDFKNKFSEINNFYLNLDFPISGHKFWNLLMANLYYNFEKDYNKMIHFMHNLLEVKWKVIPITSDSAFIQAELEDWTIIETQDKISNVADYNSPIEKIELMQNSINAKLNSIIENTINNSDYIIIAPWDLFTSILSNFIIENFSEIIKNSNKKIIYILNSSNKKWETTWYKAIDFIDKITEKTWKIDYLFWNDTIPELTKEEEQNFKKDISIKWWNYLILDENTKKEIQKKYPEIKIISRNYINDHELYKYNEKLIEDLIDILK